MRRIFRLSLLRPREVDREVEEEIAFHLAMRESKLRAQGLSEREAARAARARFGNLAVIRADCLRESHTHARSERTMRWLEEARQDVHFAIRSLLRAKSFTVAVVLTLALGIGANTTIFSLTNAFVLRPVAGLGDVEELFELTDVTSYPAFKDLRASVPAIGLAAIRERRIALGHGAGAEHMTGALVSGNFFTVARVGVALGRAFSDADDVAGAAPVGVLSYEYWKRGLGADSSILGRVVTVNGAPVTVVGIAARDFRGLHLGSVPVILVPINAWTAIAPSSRRPVHLEERGWTWLSVVGRLAPGVTLAQAHSMLANAMKVISPGSARDEIEQQSTPRPAQAAALGSDARDSVVRFAAILATVVALVLIAACANIAGLLLARAAYRQREIAVRIAVGAGRGRLVRQLLTEALLLAGAGGIVGVGFFLGARALIERATFPGDIPGSSLGLSLDLRLLAFAVLASIVTGLLVGVVPAFQASRPDTVSSLKGSAAARGSRQQILRGALVTAQVAVGVVLLVGTGLFTRALGRGLAVDLGFDTEHLAMLTVDPGLAQLDAQRASAYYAAVTARVASIPGVGAVTWTATSPLSSEWDRETAGIEGYTPGPGERVAVEWNVVGWRYHEVLGIPMVTGRGFDERDGPGSPRVIIINETTAKRYFAGRNPIGAHVTMGGGPSVIIGVARDAKYRELGEAPRPYAYFTLPQSSARGGIGAPTLIVRANADAAALLPSVVESVQATDPAVPVFGAMTMSDRLRSILAPQLAGAMLLAVFSVLALVVAAVGIYGIVAYAVSRQTREIGIRMALGARRANVLRLVVGGNLLFVAVGIPIGIAVAVVLARGMTRFLYGVGTTDLLMLVGTSALMLAVGLIASYVPARRAVQVDPLNALRADG